MSASFLAAVATRSADASPVLSHTYVDMVLGNADLLDIIFCFLPEKTSLRDRTMTASTCQEFATYRPCLRRERLVQLATLAQCNQRYFSMRQCTRQIVRLVADDNAPSLSREGRKLFADSYRGACMIHREKLAELQLFEENERAKETPSTLLGLVAGYRRQLFGKIRSLVEDLVDQIDGVLLPRTRALCREPPSTAHRFSRNLDAMRDALRREDEVFYLKLRADGLRWLAETCHHATSDALGNATRRHTGSSTRGEVAAYSRKAEAAYLEALALAEAHLPWDTTRLSCANNYAVLLVEVLQGRRKEGMALAKEAYEQASRVMYEQSEQLDTVMRLVRDNIRLWSAEEIDERTTRRAFDDSVVDYRDLWGIPPRQPWVRRWHWQGARQHD